MATVANCIAINAQVAYWAIHPAYDSIRIMEENVFMVSKDGKYGIMGKDGKEILPIAYDSIADFRNGAALLFKGKDKSFCGFVTGNGRMVDLARQKYATNNECPNFREGFLIVNDSIANYYILDQGNGETYGPFKYALPCNEGFAAVMTRHGADNKNTWALFSEETRTTISFGPDIDPDDISLVSSVSHGKAIVVVKKRFYEYDTNAKTLTSLSVDGTADKKSLVAADSRNIVASQTPDGRRVVAKNALFDFDKMMRLKWRQYAGQQPQVFDIAEDSIVAEAANAGGCQSGGSALWGMTYKGTVVLPQQFEEVMQAVGDMAVVRQNGLCGVIAIDGKGHFAFKLNDNKAVAFEHGYYNSSLVATFPPYISPAKTKVESLTKECLLKPETRKDNQNIETSSITYDCQLTMNDDITEDATPVEYKFTVVYDGLFSGIFQVALPERYIKAYEVEITGESLKNQVAEISFDVKPLSPSGGRFQKKVEVEPEKDEQVVVVEQVGEDSYKAKIYGLESNVAMFDVIVTEDGCPAVAYPFLETIAVDSEKKPAANAAKKSRGTTAPRRRVRRSPQGGTRQDAPIVIPH